MPASGQPSVPADLFSGPGAADPASPAVNAEKRYGVCSLPGFLNKNGHSGLSAYAAMQWWKRNNLPGRDFHHIPEQPEDIQR